MPTHFETDVPQKVPGMPLKCTLASYSLNTCDNKSTQIDKDILGIIFNVQKCNPLIYGIATNKVPFVKPWLHMKFSEAMMNN